MEALIIVIIVLVCLFALYFSYCLIVTFLAYKHFFGTRCYDKKYGCYVRYNDLKDITREEYTCYYYGQAINGFIYKNNDSKKGFIILAHGMFGTHVQYLVDIDMLVKAGYTVLAYDQLGCGISDGNNQYSLATGIYVMENVIEDVFKRNINNNMKVFLYGHSWGAYSALGAMRNYPQITGVVARSGVVDPLKSGEYLFSLKYKKLALSVKPLSRLAFFALFGFRHMIKSSRGFKNKTTKVFLTYAFDDPLVNLENSQVQYCFKHKFDTVSTLVTDKGLHNSLITEESYHKFTERNKEYLEIEKLPEDKRDEAFDKLEKETDKMSMLEYNSEVKDKIIQFLDSLC